SHGANGVAIAQGTHTGIVTGEFGFDAYGGNITAISMKKQQDDDDDDWNDKGKDNDKKGNEDAVISDWVTCTIPGGFVTGFDPHTVSAYQSPKNGDAIGLVANQ